jgi:putative addiction module killer protein
MNGKPGHSQSGSVVILARIQPARRGNLGDVKAVGAGISEMRIDVGAGYRVYFVRRQRVIIVLLCGGAPVPQLPDRRRCHHRALGGARRPRDAQATGGRSRRGQFDARGARRLEKALRGTYNHTAQELTPLLTSLIVSTVAYFIAAFYIKRYLDDSGIPKGLTRTLVILVLALAIAYGAAALVDWAIR